MSVEKASSTPSPSPVQRQPCVLKDKMSRAVFRIFSESRSIFLHREKKKEKKELKQSAQPLLEAASARQLGLSRDHLLLILGQIFGDRLIRDSELEKLPFHVGVQTMRHLLSLVQDIPETVMQMLEQLQQTSDAIEQLPEKIKEACTAREQKVAELDSKIKEQEKLKEKAKDEVWKIDFKIESNDRSDASQIKNASQHRGMHNYKEIDYDAFNKELRKQRTPWEQAIQDKEKEIGELKRQKTALSRKEIEAEIIYEYAQEITQKIWKLQVEERFILEGGRVTEEGVYHSVLFEFQRKESNSYNLAVYLPGKEAHQYRTLLYTDRKTLLRPVIHYQNILQALLFFTDDQQSVQSDFFQTLLETRVLHHNKYRAEYVALHLLGHLQSDRVIEPANSTSGFIAGSQSNIDVWRGLKALISRHLGEEKYKKTVAEIRYLASIEAYLLSKEELAEDTHRAEQLRELIQTGARGLLKTTKVLKNKGWIDPKTRDDYRAIALFLIGEIKKAKQAVAQLRKAGCLSFQISTLIAENQREERAQTVAGLAKFVVKPKIGKPMESEQPLQMLSLPDPDQLLQTLQHLHKGYAGDSSTTTLRQIQKGKNSFFTTQVAEIMHLVGQFPLPHTQEGFSYWSKVPEWHRNEIVELLDLLLRDFNTATYKVNPNITPRETNTVSALYALIHHLAIKIDLEKHSDEKNALSLSHYPLYFPGMQSDEDQYLIFTSPEDFERQQALVSYFKTTYTENPNAGYALDFTGYWGISFKKRGEVPYPLFDFGSREYGSIVIQGGHLPGLWMWLDALGVKYSGSSQGSSSLEERIKNLLPELTKITGGFFQKHKLNYIPVLAHAAFVAHQFSSHKDLREGDSGLQMGFGIRIKHEINRPPQVSYWCGSAQLKNRSVSSLSMHPPLSRGYEMLLSDHSWNKRIQDVDSSCNEGKVLSQRVTIQKNSQTLAEGEKLLRYACEYALFPTKLIIDYHGHLSFLETAEEQALFEISFFRTVAVNPEKQEGELAKFGERWSPYLRSTHFPLQAALRQYSFQERCRLFIQAGIDRYLTRQPNGRPQIYALLFFLRLNIRLSRFLEGEMLVDAQSIIERLLERQDLIDEECTLLSLHLILAYGAKKEKLSPLETEKFFAAWVFYQNTPASARWRNPLLEKEAFRFVYEKAELLASCSSPFLFSLLQNTLVSLKVGSLPSDCTISSSAPHLIRAQLSEQSFWELNMLTGQVYNESGLLQRVAAPSWIKDPLFAYFFAKKSFSYLQIGDAFYFTDPQLGSFRVLGSKFKEGLQRNIEGIWYQYIPPIALKRKGVPSSLLANYSHWYPINSQEPHLLIHDNQTGKFFAKIKQDGEIERSAGIALHGVENGTVLSKLDQAEYLLLEAAEQGSTLFFTRYVSLNKQPLKFDIVNDQAIYTLNKNYLLAQSQPEGWMGGIGEYLVLNHKEGEKQKVLIPLRPLASYRSLGSKHHLDVIDQAKDWKGEDEFYATQRGVYTYLEYDYIDGKISPLSQEAIFYLAYLLLTQREYIQAVEWIRKINYRETLSENSLWIIQIMVQLTEQVYDPSPEAAAVVLHGWVLATRACKRAKIEQRELHFKPVTQETQLTYLRFSHRLPPELLLNHEDSLFIQERRSRFALVHCTEIDKFKTAPYRKQYHIREAELPYPGRGFYGYDYHRGGKDLACENNRRHVLSQTDYLPDVESALPPSNYRKPFLLTQQRDKPYFQTAFFPEAYQIARSGRPVEKAQLAFRMQLIGELYPNSLPSNTWGALQYALNCSYSEPLPDHSNLDKRWSFAQAVTRHLSYRVVDSERFDRETHSNFSGTLPSAGLAAAILPPKEIQPVASCLNLEIPTIEEIDDDFIPGLFQTYFQEEDKEEQAEIEVSFEFQPEWCSKEEEAFEEVLKTVFSEFDKDYKKGKKQNAKRKTYSISDCEGLKGKLTLRQEQLKNDLISLESAILELANQKAADDIDYRLANEAHLQNDLTLKNLTDLFLTGDANQFAKANPYLRNSALTVSFAQALGIEHHENCIIHALYNWMGLYMVVSVNMERLKRAEKLCIKILKIPQRHAVKKEALTQQLAKELTPLKKAVYSMQEYPAFLVFEYLSQMSLRPNQAKRLKKFLLTEQSSGAYTNRVSQLMMGEGKTTVLAVILLKLAARSNRLSLFITPSSQYASVSYNLRKAQREYFGQDTEEINVGRSQLNLAMCKEIENRLSLTIKQGDFLLIKPETLQCLELEFLDLLYKITQASKISNDMLEKVNSLRKSLLIFKEVADALMDEIDLILYVLQETTFPIGDEMHLDPKRIALVMQMFVLFASSSVPISATETVDLKEKIGLLKNQQTLLSQNDLNGVVAQAVAWNLARDVEELQLQEREDFHPSFYRYISGKMNFVCQQMLDCPDHQDYSTWESKLTEEERKDFEFLSYLKKLATQPGEDEEAAHQIALIKHLFEDVLPVTFEKMGGRNYGRGGPKPGGIRPFLAVDTPSDNLVGYHWEAVIYHFQTALQIEMTPEHFKAVAFLYRTQAETFAEKHKIKIDETVEAVEFAHLTGISLFEIDAPGKLEEGLHFLKDHIYSILKLEAETISELTTFHLLRLTSTGCALVKMVNTVRGMSGTPYNWPHYDKSLADKFKPAWGTEGSIADIVLNRAATPEKSRMHIVKTSEIQEILEQVLKGHPKKDQAMAWLDPGGLFKNYTNIEVASSFTDSCQKPVFFFTRNPKTGEKTPDTLALLPLDSKSAVIIGGTRPEDIEKTGLEEGQYFVYFDERHTTGADMPLPPDAVGFLTLDETMLRKFFFQALIRFRHYFSHQAMDFVILEHILKAFISVEHENENVKLILSVIITYIKNQAIKLSKHFYKSCKQKIDNIFRQELLSLDFLKKELTQILIKEIFTPFIPVIIANQADRPYHQFGSLKYPVDSMQSLNAYKDRKLEAFKVGRPKEEVFQRVSEALGNLLEEIEKSPFKPKTVLDSEANELGSEVDIFAELASQQQQEVQAEVDQELLKELNLYSQMQPGRLRREDEWDDETFLLFCKSLQSGKKTFTPPAQKKGDFTLHALPSLFKQEWYKYKHDYSAVFDDSIFTTQSWAHNYEAALPMFHPMQRPAEQLLIVKKADGFCAILLAQKEARQFKSFLNKHYPKEKALKNIWLVHRDGTLFEDNPSGPLPSDKKIAEILLQCNIFDGQIDYLERHPHLTKAWLNSDPKEMKLKINFLHLKVANNKVQKNFFFKSDLFSHGKSGRSGHQLLSRIEAAKIQEMSKEKVQALTEKERHVIYALPTAQLNLLLPAQVKFIDPTRIGELHNKELVQAISQEHVEKMTVSQMPLISPTQVPWFENSIKKTQQIPISLATHMTPHQFATISPSQIQQISQTESIARLEESQYAHICGEQVEAGLIPEVKIPFLRASDAIQALPSEQLPSVPKPLRELHLSRQQVVALNEEEPLHTSILEELTPTQKMWRKPPSPPPEPEITPPPSQNTQKELPKPPQGDLEIYGSDMWRKPPSLPPEEEESEITPPPSQHFQQSKNIPLPGQEIPHDQESALSEDEIEWKDWSASSESEKRGHRAMECCRRVTLYALPIIAILTAVGSIAVGAFAIVGAHVPNAPQFMVIISQGLGSPITAYAMTGVGGVLFLSLVSYAIYLCSHSRRHHRPISQM